jgi:hypothetical protein
MSVVTPELLRFVATRAAESAVRPHQQAAITARSYSKLLTEGERWFLDVAARLSVLSDRQQARLNDIALKIERARR